MAGAIIRAMFHRMSLAVVLVLAVAAPSLAQASTHSAAARARCAQGPPPNSPPGPVVIFIHGGGWVQGTKEGSALQGVLPYVAMGYSVVNVEYRLANVSLAPAAIEDCRCALRWVVAHAKDYDIDVDRIVVAGAS